MLRFVSVLYSHIRLLLINLSISLVDELALDGHATSTIDALDFNNT